jgi:hypothetical protein
MSSKKCLRIWGKDLTTVNINLKSKVWLNISEINGVGTRSLESM